MLYHYSTHTDANIQDYGHKINHQQLNAMASVFSDFGMLNIVQHNFKLCY